MSRYSPQLRFPNVCAKCLALSPAKSWRVSGATSGLTILLRVRTTNYSLDVPVCEECQAALRRAYNISLIVGIGFFILFTWMGSSMLASPYPVDEISIGIAAIVSYFLVSLIIYPVAVNVTGAKIGKISGTPPKVSFNNQEYDTLYKAINPFG